MAFILRYCKRVSKRLNKLSIIRYQSQWRPDVLYSMLAIDGIAFDKWLAQFTDNKPFDPNNIDNVRDLALALELDSDRDTEVVWQYLGRLDNGCVTYVPLLVCPDDGDVLHSNCY